jgi:hypothetical protein
MTDADRDILILATTAFAEASSEGPAGIRAQVHSVVNRHATGLWYAGKTLAACCLLPYAYSAWNTADHNRVRALETATSDPVMATCLDEAALAISGKSLDPTDGATHYYVQGTTEPDWVSGIDHKTGAAVAPPAVFTCQIGRHLYYKGVQ